MNTRKIPYGLMIIVLIAIALAAAGCSSGSNQSTGPTVVQAKLNEYNIILDKTSIPAGPVQFTIENIGTEVHEVVLEPAGAEDEPFELNGEASEAEDIQPGEKRTLEWTLDQPGDYQLGCYVTNEGDTETHAMKGMITTFTVTQP
jgi:uncharacterized cupredoxin-like copper-binding protein